MNFVFRLERAIKKFANNTTKIKIVSTVNTSPWLPILSPAIARPLPLVLFLVVADNPAILNSNITGSK
jgi:hypothetical protein